MGTEHAESLGELFFALTSNYACPHDPSLANIFVGIIKLLCNPDTIDLVCNLVGQILGFMFNLI